MAARKAGTRKASSKKPKAPANEGPILEAIERGEISPVYLATGDSVLAEPVAQRIAEQLARRFEVEITSERRPAGLGRALQDLRTYSLFDSGKVVLILESALLADRSSAADLIDEAAEVLPFQNDEGDLSPKEVTAAGRLLQVLRLFGVDPGQGSAERAIGNLPSWALQGGKKFRKKRNQRGRGKKQVEALSIGLTALLDAGLEAGLKGWAENDAAELSEVIDSGLPDGHALVLCESAVAMDHPLVKRLIEANTVVDLGHVEIDQKGVTSGADKVAAELERETGVSIVPAALQELTRRTLRKTGSRGNRGAIDPESTTRLAGEYRKLATLAEEGKITLDLVKASVDDRGEEDVWKLLDSVGDGRPPRSAHAPAPNARVGRRPDRRPAQLLLADRRLLSQPRRHPGHLERARHLARRAQLQPLQGPDRSSPAA